MAESNGFPHNKGLYLIHLVYGFVWTLSKYTSQCLGLNMWSPLNICFHYAPTHSHPPHQHVRTTHHTEELNTATPGQYTSKERNVNLCWPLIRLNPVAV